MNRNKYTKNKNNRTTGNNPLGQLARLVQQETQKANNTSIRLTNAWRQYPVPTREKGSSGVPICVIEQDTYDAAYDLVHTDECKSVVVLNMASKWKAGGGWLNGKTAQEESLCYRSTLFRTLEHQVYPLQENEVIYSPEVTVYRDSKNPWLKLPKAEQLSVSVISAAALCKPKCVGYHLSAQDYKLMRYKILNVLATAQHYGHDGVVLGAWGCGAYRNPVSDIAELFREVLQYGDQAPAWSFKKVVFAIKGLSKYPEFDFS